MTEITIKFSSQTELFHFLQNIANAQEILADMAETGQKDSETLFSIMSLAKIQKQASIQLAEMENKSGYNLPGKNPDFFIPMSDTN